MMELMRARLAPDLRAKVLAFLPPAPTAPMPAPPPELPIELYYRWLHRTAPLLRTLAFAPSPPSPPSPPRAPPAGVAAAAAAAARVAVIIEPRAEAEVVWRTAQVMRNVAVMLGPGWGMQVFHGDRNCALLKAHFSEEEQAQRQYSHGKYRPWQVRLRASVRKRLGRAMRTMGRRTCYGCTCHGCTTYCVGARQVGGPWGR